MQRGASSLGLFVALAAVLAGARARDLDEDIAETWETTGGDVVVKLVTDLENDPVNAGRKLVKFMRSNDYRIVRFQLSNEARGKQLQFAQTDGIRSVLKMLKQDDVTQRNLAAELIHLVTTENGPLAHLIGVNAWLPGMAGLRELLDMVNKAFSARADEDLVFGGEEAAQAVWAMILSNADNLEMAHDRKGGDVFKDAIVISRSPRLKMWAAACMKRLLSDIYNTPDGSYASTARKVVDNDRLRQQFGQDGKFLSALVQMIKKGRVKPDHPRARWPTYLELEDRTAKSMQAWAAAGALGTLAKSEKNVDAIRKAGGLQALCMLKMSPCALERVEAEAALGLLDHECNPADTSEDAWAETEL